MRNTLDIVYVPITAIKPSPHAVRHHNQEQLKKLKSLITKFGQVAPIIVGADNVIVDGHAVHQALAQLGYDEIAVVTVHNRSEGDIRALRLALNRIGEETKWDQPKLKAEFEALLTLGFDLEFTAFDTVEIDMSLSIEEPIANTVEERAAEDCEPRAGHPVSRLGDVWHLGQHIVLCGDARDGTGLAGLVGDGRATTVFTDPPYNVRIGNFVSGLGRNQHREFAMASGEMSRQEFVAFLSSFIQMLKPSLTDGAILFVCMDWRHAGELLEAANQQALEFKNLCVWVKSNAGMGSFYRSQHELVFVFKHGTAQHRNNFGLGKHGRSRSNVWNYRGVNTFSKDRNELLAAHPTVKPVTMIADALRDVSNRGEIVIDPFLGSGSTLIAAEDIGRVCFGIEIDPAYVDVAIRRWQKKTGRDAVNAATGETFSTIAARPIEAQPASASATSTEAPIESPTPTAGAVEEGGRHV